MDFSIVIVVVCFVLAVALVVIYLVFGRSEANFTMDIGGAAPKAAGGSDSSSEKTTSSRLVGLLVGVGAVFSVLVARLWSMQLVSSEEYAELVQLAMDRTGISNRAVIEASLDSVNYVYGNDASLGDTADKPLASLEDAVADLVDNLGLAGSVERQGFSDTYEFAQRYVNGGYLAKALDYEKSESGYSMSTVRVGVPSGSESSPETSTRSPSTSA